jgi:hypothetical protein
VPLGERVGAALRLGEQRVDGRVRVLALAVEQRAQVPGDRLEGGIAGGRGGHAP